MFFMVYLFLFLSVVGLAGVASNPSPNYAALSLVVVAGSGCGLLASLGSPFLSLVLFLVYLGGMLVVFAYSIAFTNSFNTNNLGDSLGFDLFIILMPVVMICFLLFDNGLESEMLTVGVDFEFNSLVQDNVMSVGVLYTGSAGFLVFGSLALLVSLLVVLVVVRGSIPGGLRAV